MTNWYRGQINAEAFGHTQPKGYEVESDSYSRGHMAQMALPEHQKLVLANLEMLRAMWEGKQ